MARKPVTQSTAEKSLVERLLNWAPAGRQGMHRKPEVHIIRRSMLEDLRVDPSAKREVGRPNFLSKIKAFAVGE